MSPVESSNQPRRRGRPRKDANAPKVAGVGPSPVFGGNGAQTSDGHDWANATIQGQPVPEYLKPGSGSGIPPIDWRHTDQGIAEFNAGKEPVTARVTRDAVTAPKLGAGVEEGLADAKRFGDANSEVLDWDTKNPLDTLADAHTPPGHRGRWMSQRNFLENGGARNFQPVVKDGKRVEYGGMFLASMPESVARQRDTVMAKRADDLVEAHNESALEQVTEDSGPKKAQILEALHRSGDTGLQFERGGY